MVTNPRTMRLISISVFIIALAVAALVVTKLVGHHPTNCTTSTRGFGTARTCTQARGLW